MPKLSKLATYFHTLKYLKAEQFYHRIVKKIQHPNVNKPQLSLAEVYGSWKTFELYEPKLLSKCCVTFLNHEVEYVGSVGWNDESQAKLWLYNLHYFDDLNAFGSSERRTLQTFWVERWVTENPAPRGNGWEPYPISLRTVNWVKAFLSGLDVKPSVLDSLTQQVDFLSQDLEYHLLGNHLFVNAKALIFAGCFFEGVEAEKWLSLGIKIYKKELAEQVLADGGNYELTPMYHVIMLVDLLDLVNLFNAYPSKVDNKVVYKTKQVAEKMLVWLERMSHTDGKIGFFNDAAWGIAPSNDIVFSYAEKLGLKLPSATLPFAVDLQHTGYVSIKSSDYSLLCDLANVGPDYQPGHAHADTLSFELCLGDERVFVNSGISEYGVSDERLRQRKVAAHNTVKIDGMDSSEVWSGFRVARRAKIFDRKVAINNGSAVFSASHNGFAVQGTKCVHNRKFYATLDTVEITDTLSGHFDEAIGHLHIHPDVCVQSIETLSAKTIITLQSHSHVVHICVEGATVTVEETTWHPEFGKVLLNKKLIFKFKGNVVNTVITWQKAQIA